MKLYKLLLLFSFLVVKSGLYAFELKLLELFEGAWAPKAVEVSPDGSYAVAVNLEGLNFWMIDTQTLQIIKVVSFYPFRTAAQGYNYSAREPIDSYAEKPVEAAFQDNGRYVWISFHNGKSVVRYDTQSADTPQDFENLQDVKVYDKLAGTNYTHKIVKIKVGKTPKVIAVTPDESLILVANWHSSSVSVITASNLTKVADIKVGGDGWFIPRGIAIASDSKTAYIANMSGGTISVISLESLTVIEDIPITYNPRHLILSGDDRYLYISDNAAGKVIKYDLVERKIAAQVIIGKKARTIAITPDERYIFAASHGTDEIVTIDNETFEIIDRMEYFKPMGLSVSPDGKQLWITSYQGGYVSVYEIIY